MSRKAKRVCSKCGKANSTIYSVCNPCRAEGCLHPIIHFDSNHAAICDDCGSVVAARKKIVGHSNGAGVFPGAMMSQYRSEDLS
jgi:NMD protein affecting ribosome stability and mRNA decay